MKELNKEIKDFVETSLTEEEAVNFWAKLPADFKKRTEYLESFKSAMKMENSGRPIGWISPKWPEGHPAGDPNMLSMHGVLRHTPDDGKCEMLGSPVYWRPQFRQ